jgi:hypothetical protein
VLNWVLDQAAAAKRAWDVWYYWPKVCQEVPWGQSGIAFYSWCCDRWAWMRLGSYEKIQEVVVELKDPNHNER